MRTGVCGELCSPIPAALPRWDSHFPFALPGGAWKLPELPIPQLEPSKTILIPWKSPLLPTALSGRRLRCFLLRRIPAECLTGAVHRSLRKSPGCIGRDLGLFGFPGNCREGTAEFYKRIKLLWDKGGSVWSRVGNGGIRNEGDVETTRIQSLENSTPSARGNIPGGWKSLRIHSCQDHIPTPNAVSHQRHLIVPKSPNAHGGPQAEAVTTQTRSPPFPPSRGIPIPRDPYPKGSPSLPGILLLRATPSNPWVEKCRESRAVG